MTTPGNETGARCSAPERRAYPAEQGAGGRLTPPVLGSPYGLETSYTSIKPAPVPLFAPFSTAV